MPASAMAASNRLVRSCESMTSLSRGDRPAHFGRTNPISHPRVLAEQSQPTISRFGETKPPGGKLNDYRALLPSPHSPHFAEKSQDGDSHSRTSRLPAR